MDGFVLVDRGHHSPPVSQSVWLFCLAYGGLTFLMLLVAIAIIRVVLSERWAGMQKSKWLLPVSFWCGY